MILYAFNNFTIRFFFVIDYTLRNLSKYRFTVLEEN